MAIESTGVATLDAFLGGGLLTGDNVVWIADDRPAALWFCRRMLEASAGPGPTRLVSFARDAQPAFGSGVEVIDLSEGDGRTDPSAVAERILALQHPEGSRIVFDGLDALVTRWGAAAALELYTRVCPRLFERGAIAYWTGSRAWLSTGLIESTTKIAQCVFEVRDRRLRVAKAEGRPSHKQGALAEVIEGTEPGTYQLGREHIVGRVGAGLRRVRRTRNLTQGQLAALAHVTPAAISQAESGRRGLSLDTLVPLCETLGIGLDDLLGTPGTEDVVLARRDRLAVGRDVVALFDDPARGLRTYLVSLGPGESGSPPFTHKGVELVLVIAGLVLVDTGDATPVLRAGDASMVRRVVIERWTNLGDELAQLFWVASDLTGPVG